MANFPTSLDSLANPTSSTYTDDAGFELDVVISTLNDIAEALETKMGIGASTATNGTVFLGTGTGTSGWGSLTTAYVPDRTRTLFVPASAMTAVSGSPSQSFAHAAVPYWALDWTVDEGVAGAVLIPNDWTSGTITAKLWWTVAVGSPPSGNVVWALGTHATTDGAATNRTWVPSAAGVAHAVPGTALNAKVTSFTSALASVAAGVYTGVLVQRVGSSGGDSYAADALVLGIQLDYTADS